MILSLKQEKLLEYVRTQCNTFFPDGYDLVGADVEAAYKVALDRIENCYKVIKHPGYRDKNKNPTFSHLHADQYAQFLYFFSNSLWHLSQNKALCDKLLQLNRTLNAIFISYKGNLPEHFLLGHPVGTILGNASYGDFLVVFQGVTVNTDVDENGEPAPKLGKGLFLGAHAKIIGNQPIGDRVSIGVNALVYQKSIPHDSVVTCEVGNCCFVRTRQSPYCKAQDYFDVEI